MKDNHIISVLIEDEASMKKLGMFIGQGLFAPILRVTKPCPSSVVCAYGVENAGKSTLFDAAEDTIERGTLVSYDFGRITYPLLRDSMVYDAPHYHATIMARENKPTIFVFEHPPVHFLKNADIGVIVSVPLTNSNEFYLNIMAFGMEDRARENNALTERVQDVATEMRNAENEALAMKFGDNMRHVKICLLATEKPEIVEAFKKTAKAIAKEFKPVPRHRPSPVCETPVIQEAPELFEKEKKIVPDAPQGEIGKTEDLPRRHSKKTIRSLRKKIARHFG